MSAITFRGVNYRSLRDLNESLNTEERQAMLPDTGVYFDGKEYPSINALLKDMDLKAIPVTYGLRDYMDEPDSPFIKQLTEEFIADMESQCAHLEGLSKRPESEEEKAELERWQHMADGARKILNMLSDSTLGKRGTDAWLKLLTVDQLRHAKQSIEQLLDTRENEGHVVLYIGRALYKNVAFFSQRAANAWVGEQLRIAAADPVAALGRPYTKQSDTLFSNSERFQFVVEKTKVRSSELNEYLGCNPGGDSAIPDEVMNNKDRLDRYIKARQDSQSEE